MNPGLAAPDLVSMSDAGYAAFKRIITHRAGGRVIEEHGLLHIAGKHRAPFLVNGTCRVDRSTSSVETIERARDYAAQFGRVAAITTSVSDQDLEAALLA